MKLFEMLFELIRLHVPISRDSFAKMKQGMEDDTRDWSSENPNKFKAMYAKYNDMWWFNLCVALAFIPLTRWISEYMSPIAQNEDDEQKF